MHTEFQPEDPEVLKEMKYDRRDLKIPMLKKWTFGITLSCVICFIVSIPAYNWVSTPGNTWESIKGASRQPAPPSQMHMAPINPMLQDNLSTKTDIQHLRLHEEDILRKPHWVDQTKGVVSIPIEKAMKMVVDRGVATGAAVPAFTKGNTIPQNAVGPGSSKQTP